MCRINSLPAKPYILNKSDVLHLGPSLKIRFEFGQCKPMICNKSVLVINIPILYNVCMLTSVVQIQ